MKKHAEQTIQISLTWVVVGVVFLFLFGLLGGVLAQYILPAAVPVTSDGQQIVTTVQEVTLSPSQAAADVVEEARRSVFVVGPVTDQFPPSLLATAALVTNDGIIMTAGSLPQIPLQAYDMRGRAVSIDIVGYDALFDITFYRLRSGVFSPLDIARQDPAVGHELLAVSFSPDVFSPKIARPFVESYRLPEAVAAGIPRVIQLSENLASFTRGTPLLTEDGRLAGLLRATDEQTALTALQLDESLNRLTQNTWDQDPITLAGIRLDYEYSLLPTQPEPKFVARVVSVTPSSPAQQAGLQPGDLIEQINGNELKWEESVVAALSGAGSRSLTFYRQGETIQATLTETP